MVHVMSEVIRFDPVGTIEGFEESEFGQYCFASDLDAQRLRADTAEAEISRLRETATLAAKVGAPNFHSMKRELAAAEQRIAKVTELLRLMTVEYACCLEAGHDRITFLGNDCDSVSKMLDDNVNYAKACAALNPNPEAESHE